MSFVPTNSGGSALTSLVNFITAPVTMTNANQFYDGPQLTLAAGTWVLAAAICLLNNSAAVHNYTIKIWDGTTAYGTSSLDIFNTASDGAIYCIAQAVLTVGATLKASVAASGGGDQILATARANGVANLGSGLVAIRTA